MIVYKNSARGFCSDVEENKIADVIESKFITTFGRRVQENEKRSWRNSMNYMERVIRRSELDDSCGILIEYTIPSTSKRIDFIVSGYDENDIPSFVIIEIKQWDKAEKTEQDGVVKTFMNRSNVDTTHPSYQAFSYKTFMTEFNENIQKEKLQPHACCYLHNYTKKEPEPLLDPIYLDIVEKSPIYFKDDFEKLQKFLKDYVGKGRGEEILYTIESGQIKPSKNLINHVCGLLKGHQEFTLLDEQKVAYEKALSIGSESKEKEVVIIKGGPGTGKSVISINLLGGLLNKKKNVIFVAPNASFRTVIAEKLKKENKKSEIDHLFRGSSGFVDTEENIFDVIVVDEAHRLKNKTAYQYYGYNQIDDIVKSSLVSIFFVDEAQMIRPEDIGSIDEIKNIAEKHNATVTELELSAQFRCSGAEGYINWLDNTLHLKETANYDGWEDSGFEFIIFDDPNELKNAIDQKIIEGKDARIVAGYAWPWTSEKKGNKDANINDIEIKQYDFSMPWNSRKLGTRWAIAEEGINQIGCIHTAQGLEFDYIGVIVGKDLRFDPSSLEYSVDWSSYKDNYGKKTLKDDPEELSKLVRNIYKVLMSRGMKGCYVYFADKNTRDYFLSRLQ
jgi:uncharacterized protein